MTQISDAISELCVMASEEFAEGKLDNAAKLFDLALDHMLTTEAPEGYRALAERSRGVLHMIAHEYPQALAALRTLRGQVRRGADETRKATLEMVGDLANYPGIPPSEILVGLLDDGIGCLDLCVTLDERAKLEVALLRLARNAIPTITANESRSDAEELARFRAFADRLLFHAKSMTAHGVRLVLIILGFVTTLAAMIDGKCISEEVTRLTRWCDRHALWCDNQVRYAIIYALMTALDRLKTEAGKNKSAEKGVLAAECYEEATRTYKLIEQHYGAQIGHDVRIATVIADAAHSLLGADAFFGRKVEATERMTRLRIVRDLYPDEQQITEVWLEAPLRYVVALALTNSNDELTAEALRARDEAKCHMSKADYKAWRKRMAGSLDSSFLEKIGF